jgi:ferredoxin
MKGGRPQDGRALAGTVRFIAALLVLGMAIVSVFASGTSAAIITLIVPSLQLLPSAARVAALTAGSLGILGFVLPGLILLASALFGRWYCAFLCPLGTLQELASHFRKKKWGNRWSSPALRAAALIAVASLAVAGALSLASWLDPWSLFSRFLVSDIQPLIRLAFRIDHPGLRPESVISAGLAMAAILSASIFSGRWFCGNLCPVGTVLGLLNRCAPFRIRIDESGCVSCGRCTRTCSVSCLDGALKRLDSTRCVYCLACLDACPTGAIRYCRTPVSGRMPAVARTRRRLPDGGRTTARPSISLSGIMPLDRKRFIGLLGTGAAALSLAAAAKKSGVAWKPGTAPGDFSGTVIPPGAGSVARFVEKCLACGLCVARCPAKIIRPSFGQLGLSGLFVPRLDYDISYCQYECTACMDVCPSGALEALDLATKKLVKMGNSTLIRDRCVVIKNRTKCGACAEHCPTGAVRMVRGETGLPEPVFDTAMCIGCGACHHACPVTPEKAISVAGYATHETAIPPSKNLPGTLADIAEEEDVRSHDGAVEEFPF